MSLPEDLARWSASPCRSADGRGRRDRRPSARHPGDSRGAAILPRGGRTVVHETQRAVHHRASRFDRPAAPSGFIGRTDDPAPGLVRHVCLRLERRLRRPGVRNRTMRRIAMVSAAQARTGTSRAAFISAAIGRGKTISVRRRSIPSAMARAASSASMMNGIGKSFDSVISVRTKPGQTVVTRTPCPAQRRAQRLEQVDLRGLRGAVGLGAGEAAVAGHRRDPDEVPAPGRDHRRDDGGQHVVEAEQVDLDVSGELVGVPGGGVELLPVAGAPDHDVEAAEGVRSPRRRRDVRRPRSVTSSGTTVIVPAATASRSSARRALIATWAPRSTSSVASAAPMPLDAPTSQKRRPRIGCSRVMTPPRPTGSAAGGRRRGSRRRSRPRCRRGRTPRSGGRSRRSP